MKRQLTFKEYRQLDLTLFALILGLSEFVIVMAGTRWFRNELYTVSVTAAVCAIVMMRWGAWAAIHAVVGGAVFCGASGASGAQFAIYCGGNLAGLGALMLLRALGSERVRKDAVLSLLFGVVTLVLMQLGRAAIAWCLGAELGSCVGFFTTDALSGLFSMVIIHIVRQLDGIFEDQKNYLIRLQGQQEKEKGGF